MIRSGPGRYCSAISTVRLAVTAMHATARLAESPVTMNAAWRPSESRNVFSTTARRPTRPVCSRLISSHGSVTVARYMLPRQRHPRRVQVRLAQAIAWSVLVVGAADPPGATVPEREETAPVLESDGHPERGRAPRQPYAVALVLVDDDAADVAARHHVLVALVDLVEGVPGGDELVELQLARPVQLEHPRDDVERVVVAEQRALQPLLERGQLECVDVYRLGPEPAAHRRHDDDAALADRGEGRRDDFLGHHAHRDERLVRADAVGQLQRQLVRLLGRRDGVGGAEGERGAALELHRVDRDDIARAGDGRALDRVDADAADAVDDGGVAGADLARVHRRADAGGHAAADQRDDLEREVVLDLDRRVLGDHGVLRERAEQAHLPEVGGALVVAVGAVWQ